MPGTSNLSGDQSIFFGDNASFDGTHRDGKLGSDGEIWMGSTAGNADSPNYTSRPVRVGSLVSTDGSLDITYSDIGDTQGQIDLTISAGNDAILKLKTQDGNEVPPTAGIVNVSGGTAVAGTSPVTTTGVIGTSTVTTVVQISQALAGTDATKIGLSNFDSAAFDVDANGFVQLNGGGIAATAFDVQANTAPGTDPVVPTAAGVVTVNGAVVANHSVVLESRSRAANAYNLEVQYATSAAATDGTKSGVAHFDSARFSVDASGFVTVNGSGLGETITGDSGGALSPTSGNWNILGRSGSKTSGSGSTLTVKSPPYSEQAASTTITLNSGSFSSGVTTLTLPASAGLLDGDLFEFVCVDASQLTIQAVGSQKIRFGTLITSAAGTLKSTSIGDSVSFRYREADGFFYVTSSIGTWLVA